MNHEQHLLGARASMRSIGTMPVLAVTALFGVLGPSQGMAQAGRPATFDTGSIAPFADSLVTFINGQQRGWHRYTLIRTASGFTYTDEFALGSQMSRTTRLTLSPRMAVLTDTVTGQQFDQPVQTTIRFEGQRVTGWVQSAPPGTPGRFAVDTVLPTGAFDGAALMALLPLLDWRTGAVYHLTIFDAEDRNITTQTLRILGVEDVTVPAGTFSAFRAILTTTQSPVVVWYTRARPHHLLKVGGISDAFYDGLASHSEQ